jgi:hypothetical protein
LKPSRKDCHEIFIVIPRQVSRPRIAKNLFVGEKRIGSASLVFLTIASAI